MNRIQRRKPTRGGSVWTQVQQIFFNTSSTTDVLTTCGFSGFGCPQGQGGGLLIFIHKSIHFHQQLQLPETLSDLHLDELTISAKLSSTELIISNIYIPRTGSCTAGYQPSIDHLMTTPDTLILGDFNAHHSSWHATSTDTRRKNLADSICNSDFDILNWDTPTRLPSNATPSSPDVSLASSSLITSTNWNTITTLGSDHLPILIRLQTTVSVTPASHRTYVNLKKTNWASFTQEIEDKLRNRPLPSDCQKDEKTLRAIILKAASHHIPTGRHKINTEPVPAEILELTKERDELRQRDHTSPELQRLNEEITRTTTAHKQAKWKQFVETMDHKTDSPKLWRTIRQLMASLHQRQRMKLSFSTRSLPHHRKTLPINSINSSPHQSWAYTLLHTRLGTCQGKQERSHRKRHRYSPQQWLLAQLRAAATAEPSDLICSASST